MMPKSSNKKKKGQFNPLPIIFLLIICCVLGGVLLFVLKNSNEKPGKAPVETSLATSDSAGNGQGASGGNHPDVGGKDALSIIKQNCTSCHGVDKVKGKFNIVDIIKDGIHSKDSVKWAEVISQIEYGEMPPEDSKYKISKTEKDTVLSFLNAKLNKKELQSRLLTPVELRNTVADLFDYETEYYDPFDELLSQKDSDQRFNTFKSGHLFTPHYVHALNNGLNVALSNQAVDRISRSEKTRQPNRFSLGFRHFFAPNNAPFLSFVKDAKTPEGYFVHKTPEYKAMVEKGEEAYIDIRRRGRWHIYIDWSRRFGSNFMPGKYRLTFRASALNEAVIKETYEQYRTDLNKKLSRRYKGEELENAIQKDLSRTFKTWENLISGDKFRMTFYKTGKYGHVSGRAYNPRPQVFGHKETKLQTIEITGGEKEYTLEFTLEEFSNINVSFENGPNPRRISGGAQLAKIVKQNKGIYDYKFPALRIRGLFNFERLKEDEQSEYIFRNKDCDIKGSYKDLQEQLSIKVSPCEDRFDFLKDVKDRYFAHLKSVIISPQNLNITPQGSESERTRYASYSLLKTFPTPSFKNLYSKFLSGKQTGKVLSKSILNDPSFKGFVEDFSEQWLEQEVELAPVKYKTMLERHDQFKHETVAYLMYLFKNNRPIKELYLSDYKVVDRALAKYYDLETANKVDLNKFEKVPTALGGGILQQPAFYISQSDGVDPLPFKRAKWILENIMDIKTPEPPNDIDSVDFMNSKETNSFKERIDIHAQVESCYSCHKLLDPVAIAVSHLDMFGMPDAAQKEEEAWSKLMKRLKDKVMAKAFTKSLLSYIIGRETNVYDLASIEKILERAKSSSYGVADIHAGIIDLYFK